MQQEPEDFLSQISLKPNDASYLKEDGTTRFFEKCNEYGTLSFLVNEAIFSLKNAYHYVHCRVTGATAMKRFLMNNEFDETLKQPYFKDSDNPNALTISDNSPAMPALRPYQISAAFYQQILLGNTPILNFSSVRNPYMRFYRAKFKYYRNDPKAFIDEINKAIAAYCPYSVPVTHAINYNNINYDFLVRFEKFDADMQLLFPHYQAVQVLPSMDKSYYHDFYNNQEIKDYVQYIYKEDFENFGYSFDVHEYHEYDDNVIPRNIDKFKNPQPYPFDMNIFKGRSLVSLGYFHDKKFSGSAVDFFVTTEIPPEIIDKLAAHGYRMSKFKNIEQALIDFANKLPDK